MSSTFILNVLLAVGGGLTLVGLITVIARTMKHSDSDSVFVTIERPGHSTRVLTFPPDSPQIRELSTVTTGSRPPSPESVRQRAKKVENPEDHKSSSIAVKASWLPAILRISVILAVMLGGALAGAFVDERIWAIVISIVAVLGVPITSFFITIGSEQRTQRLVASIYSFRHYERLIIKTGHDHAANHDTDGTY